MAIHSLYSPVVNLHGLTVALTTVSASAWLSVVSKLGYILFVLFVFASLF